MLAHRPDVLPLSLRINLKGRTVAIEISSDFHVQGVPQRCSMYQPQTQMHAHVMIMMIIILKATLSALRSRWETPGEPMPNVFIPNVGIEKGINI